jgi:hypothetical protein
MISGGASRLNSQFPAPVLVSRRHLCFRGFFRSFLTFFLYYRLLFFRLYESDVKKKTYIPASFFSATVKKTYPERNRFLQKRISELGRLSVLASRVRIPPADLDHFTDDSPFHILQPF